MAMTASTPPAQSISPLTTTTSKTSINGKMISIAEMKNKGRTNHTVGYFYSTAPVVVSHAVKFTNVRRNSTEATQTQQSFTNDGNMLQSQEMKGKNEGASTSETPNKNLHNLSLRQPSPQSVVPMYADDSNANASPNPEAPASDSTIKRSTGAPNTTALTLTTPASPGEESQPIQSKPVEAPVPVPVPLPVEPRKVKIERNYDMNLVPQIPKNPDFLKAWRKISKNTISCMDHGIIGRKSFSHTPSTFSLPSLVPCDQSCGDSSHDSDAVLSEGTPMAIASAASCDSSTSSSTSTNKEPEPHLPCHECLVPTNTSALPPFGANFESVIWAPKTRLDWEESIDEMVAVCTAAAWHKHTRASGINQKYKKKKDDFHPPISRIYIRDRIEIDDPLRGYQIRHKVGGWLQGFVIMTNFTTWTHYFKWDSNHPSNGMEEERKKGMLVDYGSFAEGLERQPRSGDPLAEGVVWPTIAELSLVGALGCGEYLLQMALDDIARRGTYDYVVLEATDTSRPFYEKFGFVRVGAVCKYGNEKDVKDANGEVQDVGYRHWTYATETEQNLNEHGAPSCMMARRMNKFDPDIICGGCERGGTPSFVDQLGKYFVLEKPKILPLGVARRKRSMSGSTNPNGTTAKRAKINPVAPRVTSSGRKSKVPSRLEEEMEDVKNTSKKTLGIKRVEVKKEVRSDVKKIKTESKKESDRRKNAASRVAPHRTSKNSSLPPVAPLGTDILQPKGKNNKPILLRKQKIPTMHRSPKKTYFYNKVVTPKSGQSKSKYKSKYYFVISYDMEADQMTLIPLFLKGSFKGKREGRPKWKANVVPQNGLDYNSYLESMDVITTHVSKWQMVKSYAVTKCACVHQESWDIIA